MNVMSDMLDRVSENPQLWNVLRRVVEDGFRGEKAVIEQELTPWCDVGQREFLDFGCGTGEFAPCFPANHYVGIDVAQHYIRHAATHYLGAFLAASGTALPFPAQSFDAVLVLGVLHHLPDAVVRQAMGEVERVLRPGGVALMMEDIPPPDAWNIAGHAMHALDRGGYIRSDDDYRALFGSGLRVVNSYTMRSGICDYGVYRLERQ